MARRPARGAAGRRRPPRGSAARAPRPRRLDRPRREVDAHAVRRLERLEEVARVAPDVQHPLARRGPAAPASGTRSSSGARVARARCRHGSRRRSAGRPRRWGRQHPWRAPAMPFDRSSETLPAPPPPPPPFATAAAAEICPNSRQVIPRGGWVARQRQRDEPAPGASAPPLRSSATSSRPAELLVRRFARPGPRAPWSAAPRRSPRSAVRSARWRRCSAPKACASAAGFRF